MSRSRIAQAFLAIAIIILLFAPFLVRASIRSRYESRIFESAEAPNRNTALVFGAAVNRGGWLSTVLRDRMDTAISLYKNGVVERIVVSGHQDGNGYDEPGSMKAYAIAAGVSDLDIITDTKGDRTYDTCFRARNEFQLESALLVTQEFHLPRALLTCNALGMDVDGVRADMRNYRGSSWYEFRETVATLVALADLIRKDDPDQVDIVESIVTAGYMLFAQNS
jgi:SanA protein